jgi:hypothetical protein
MNKIIPISFDERYMNHGKQQPEWTIQYYWGYNGCYFLNETESNSIIKVLDLITNQKSYTIKKGDVIYASKASELPRFKLKEFIKDNNLKKTSRHMYSDVIIINKGYFNELRKNLKIDNHIFCIEKHTKNTIKSIIKKSNVNTNTSNAITQIFNTASNYDTLCYVRVNHDSLNKTFKKYPNSKQEFENNTHSEKGIIADFYRENRLVDLLEMLNQNKNRIMKGEVKFIFDEDMFVDLNKEGIELDDDYLQTLRDMLFSSDKDNVKLGFEMMSNLVIDQPTLLSISFLLNELIHTTGFRPSYYTSSNSNLKSLLKMLKTKGIYWDKDWKTFGTGLRLNFKDGREGEIVKKFLLDNINREFKLSNSASEALVDIVFTTEINELSLV